MSALNVGLYMLYTQILCPLFAPSLNSACMLPRAMELVIISRVLADTVLSVRVSERWAFGNETRQKPRDAASRLDLTL
ncbi:hypothetical protein BV22DRAFT_314432 [Leucogyrophana mollusca]|uniref:Uncharacterized protein n=1 Tax=Leucogyrophana mollusca TaxID=85980 RepID=A0ACB8BM24_9AGAM|nr:hypothetical protein BV22DRAFT_314432 [Leucogyrophana mollusca]